MCFSNTLADALSKLAPLARVVLSPPAPTASFSSPSISSSVTVCVSHGAQRTSQVIKLLRRSSEKAGPVPSTA
jgi:hypothetical protein